MSIYKNAIDSIIIGVEDYIKATHGDEKRYISSTRNIFAGMLLLFKHKLSELSPDGTDEILIKQKVKPVIIENGDLAWSGKGTKTVDIQGIKERFKDLGINVKWSILEDIIRYRNNIEHYYSNENVDAIKGMLSNCFLIIQDFLSSELSLNPKTELGQYAWKELMKINKVYEAEKKNCNSKLEELHWENPNAIEVVKNFTCETCLSSLISVDESGYIYCKSCEQHYEQEDVIVKSLEEEYSLAPLFDEEEILINCPSCGVNSMVISHDIISCYLCNETKPSMCERCGLEIPNCELEWSENGLCSYCQHMSSKEQD